MRYQFSSDEVMDLFTLEISQLNIDFVKAYLIKVNLGLIKFDGSTPAFFEQLFLNYVLTGIEWQSQEMPLALSCNMTIDWELFSAKFIWVECTTTRFQNMEAGVLYYLLVSNFPLVDMYYKDENKTLNCIQATFAKNHAENV